MALELLIDGYVNITFLRIENGEEVSESEESIILCNLQSGNFIIGLGSLSVCNINDLSTPIYHFSITPTGAISYEFDELCAS
jgi:hypothetical protein